MEFRLLGPLEVFEDDRQVTPRRAKQRGLLAVLLLHANEPVATDLLIEGLWGERPPETALTALHGHISALRKLFGAGRIETRPPGYLLRVEPGELDLDRFDTLVAEARTSADVGQRSLRLRAALGLWRGEPLADFRYEAFAQADIARLDERRLATLEDAIDAELTGGRHLELVPELEGLVASQPLRERPRGQLMLALYRAGRQSEALHVFQQGRRVLAEEIGIDPGPALQTLQRQILAQDSALEPMTTRKLAEPRQARKVVTVLVAELSFATSIDPEDLQRLVEPALRNAREIIHRFGGTYEPLFSNALVGIFGAPHAHEDDAERAMRAASTLVNELSGGAGLRLRIGVERGDALVTVEGEHVEVTGEVLAVASRLQATSAPGEVRGGESVLRAIRERASLGSELIFVGRERELAVLERTYERVVGETAVQLVTIVGEPGSGKTRLAKEFRTLIETKAPHAWREGRCLPYGDGVTFWALGEVVKAEAAILESDDPQTSAQKLSAAVALLVDESDDRAWLETSLSPLVGIAGAGVSSREQSFAAWRRFLVAIAWREPLVMFVEDLHWADSALLDFVDDLVARASGVPLLVICTTRLELLDARPQWGGGKRNSTTITLPPLTADETRELASSVRAGAPPSEALISRAGGNPLFVLELARMSPTGTLELPGSLQDVIAARLDTLAPHVKEAAMDAAVVGEVFWSGALAAIAGADEHEVDEWLRRLVGSNVVRQARTSSVARQNEYTFLHVLVRDVAYGQIPKLKRARKHAAVAAWIERLAGERVVDHAELIAHHYASALELASPQSGDASELAAKTFRFLVVAGNRAMRLDVAAAERFYRRALTLVSTGEPEHARLLGHLARTMQEQGRIPEAERTYEEAITALRAQDDPLALGDALVGFYMALSRHGKAQRARTVLAEAVKTLEREPPGPELAAAYVNVARDCVQSGRAVEGLEWSERTIDLAAKLGLHHQIVRSLQWRGIARGMLNDLGGVANLRESLQLGLELGLGFETGLAYGNLGEWVSWTEGPAASLAIYVQGIDFSERHGLDHNVFWLKMDRLSALFALGRWDDLLHGAGEILDWEQSRGETMLTAAAQIARAGVLVRRGAITESRSLLEAFLQPAWETDDAQFLAPALSCAATIEMASGEHAAAMRRVAEFEDATRGASSVFRASSLPDIARVCAAAKALDVGRRIVVDLDVAAGSHKHAVVTANAVLAEAESNLEEALGAYTEAEARWREFGHVPEEGCALMGQGRCLVRLQRAGVAAAPLAEARLVFERLGAEPLVAEVNTLLAQAPTH